MKFFCVLFAVVIGPPMLLCAQSSASRPPITGIANVAVYGSAPDRSQDFYAGLLCLPESGIGTATQLYRVNPLQSIRIDPLPKYVAAPNGVIDYLESVTFATPDVEALRQYLIRNGIRVPDKVWLQADGARFFWVKDPEGHRIGFVQAAAHAHLVPVVTAIQKRQREEQVARHILHAGFIVQDRTVEDHFYRDVLGFHQAWEGGMKNGAIDWVDMQVPDGGDWIEYMLHSASPPSVAESGGLNHFALGVPSIQQAAGMLRRNGWHASSRQQAQIGRDGKWQLNLYDPDGTRVELMEFRPVRTPCCSPYTLPEHP